MNEVEKRILENQEVILQALAEAIVPFVQWKGSLSDVSAKAYQLKPALDAALNETKTMLDKEK